MSVGDRPLVLVLDRDATTREDTTEALSAHLNADVTEVDSFDAAIEALETEDIDCLITEYELGDRTGVELVGWVRNHKPDTPCVLYTESSTKEIRTTAFQDIIVEYLPKSLPDASEELANLVENVLAQRSQIAYPLPENEDERLAAIEQYDVAGLDAVDTIDRLTELAGNHFDVAVAFAGIVDANAEHILSCHGADWERFDREDTICTHTILDDGPLIIPDTHDDVRFANIDVLDELDIRSYAGVPLTTAGGLPIGALCLIHDEPRSYDDDEIADLQLFADEVMEQLELRRRLKDDQSLGVSR